MKRLLLPMLGVLMALILCACATAESVVETTGPDNGLLSEQEIGELLQSLYPQGYEVFFWYMGDSTAPNSGLDVVVADSDSNILPVGRFETIAELKAATEAVFSRRFCENILYPTGFNELQEDNIKFREIDGRLYVNTNNGGMGWHYALTDKITVKVNEPEKIVLTVISSNGEGDETPYDFTLVQEDGLWKLDTLFEYGTPALPFIEKARPAFLDEEQMEEPAQIGGYQSVLRSAIVDTLESMMTVGALRDIDGDGQDELILICVQDIFPMYQVWAQTDSGEALLLAEGQLYNPAGGPWGGVCLLVYEGAQYLCVWNNEPTGDIPVINREHYLLYRAQEQSLDLYYEFSCRYASWPWEDIEPDPTYPEDDSYKCNGSDITLEEFSVLAQAFEQAEHLVVSPIYDEFPIQAGQPLAELLHEIEVNLP